MTKNRPEHQVFDSAHQLFSALQQCIARSKFNYHDQKLLFGEFHRLSTLYMSEVVMPEVSPVSEEDSGDGFDFDNSDDEDSDASET